MVDVQVLLPDPTRPDRLDVPGPSGPAPTFVDQLVSGRDSASTGHRDATPRLWPLAGLGVETEDRGPGATSHR